MRWLSRVSTDIIQTNHVLYQQGYELLLLEQVYSILLRQSRLNATHERRTGHLCKDVIFDVLRPQVPLLNNSDVPIFEQVEDSHVCAKKVAPNIVPLFLHDKLLKLLCICELE